MIYKLICYHILLNYFFQFLKMFVCCCHSNNVPSVPTKEDIKNNIKVVDTSQRSSNHLNNIKEEP